MIRQFFGKSDKHMNPVDTHKEYMRFNLLQLAIEICSAEHRAKHGQHLENKFQKIPGEIRDPGPTTAPDADEIIATARKLYHYTRLDLMK